MFSAGGYRKKWSNFIKIPRTKTGMLSLVTALLISKFKGVILLMILTIKRNFSNSLKSPSKNVNFGMMLQVNLGESQAQTNITKALKIKKECIF